MSLWLVGMCLYIMYHNCTITIMQLCIFIVATFEHIKLIVFLLFQSFVQPQSINRVYSG